MKTPISTPNTTVNKKVLLTRVYRFCASHRLNSPFLSAEENSDVYGKCSHSSGHGHNYILKVTLKGIIDPVTGRLADISELDRIVDEFIIEPLDHKNLNVELKDVLIVTSEMLIEELWNKLKEKLEDPVLHKLELEETKRNSFQYFGP